MNARDEATHMRHVDRLGLDVRYASKADYVRAQDAAGDSGHLCHARGCFKPVKPAFFMCGRHWKMVPTALQRAIWRHYRPGQEIDKRASRDYLAVAQSAIDAVAAAEFRANPQERLL